MKTQIKRELARVKDYDCEVDNINILAPNELITFTVNGRGFWAKLTPTGKLKKKSIRIDTH